MVEAWLVGCTSQDRNRRDVVALPLSPSLLFLGMDDTLDQLSLLLLPAFRRGYQHLESQIESQQLICDDWMMRQIILRDYNYTFFKHQERLHQTLFNSDTEIVHPFCIKKVTKVSEFDAGYDSNYRR